MTWMVPSGGLAAYAAPDPAQVPVATIAGGDTVEVVERRGDWAHVRCTNGWMGWVDGRGLVDAPPPPAPSSAACHTVPAGGLRAWASPDPSHAPVATIDAGLTVRVLERTGDWAHVECTNGWTAWVDARALAAGAPRSGADADAATAGAAARVAFTRAATLGPVAAAGAALAGVGGWLPWFSEAGFDVDAWDTPLRYLLAGTGDGGGPDVGPFLLVPLLAAVAVVAKWRVPRWATIALAGVATNAAVFAIARVLRPEPHPSLGVGVFVTLAGGALLAWDGWRAAR